VKEERRVFGIMSEWRSDDDDGEKLRKLDAGLAL